MKQLRDSKERSCAFRQSPTKEIKAKLSLSVRSQTSDMVFADYFLCNPHIMDTINTRQKLYPSTELKLNSGRDATRLDPSGFPDPSRRLTHREMPSSPTPRRRSRR